MGRWGKMRVGTNSPVTSKKLSPLHIIEETYLQLFRTVSEIPQNCNSGGLSFRRKEFHRIP